MTEAREGTAFARVVQTLEPHSKLIRTWPLAGGVSAQVTGLELERPDGQTKKLIVRQHGAVDRKQNPHIAADEFRLLRLLHSEGLATPMPYHLDQSGKIFSTPYLVIEYIEGETDNVPGYGTDGIQQLAAHLAKIHQVDGLQEALSFLPQQEQRFANELRERPANLDESIAEGRIRDVLEAAWPVPQRNRQVLLHGDYWPGNILWRDGRIVGIIDWEDAAIGDPLADLGSSRLELLWAFGVDAMNSFTRQYQSLTTIDFTNLPYWDLCAALRPANKIAVWAKDAATEKTMLEGHRLFVAQAFEALSAIPNS